MKLVQKKGNPTSPALQTNWIKKLFVFLSRIGKSNPNGLQSSVVWGSWYFQIALFILAFLLGAIVYRSGIVRPATVYIRNIFSTVPLLNKMPQPVQEVVKNIDDEIRLYINNGLPTLYIDMSFEDYDKLLQKRNEALEIGILNTTDADFVDGDIHLQDGAVLEAKLRLKGDWTDHLKEDKWSFRIKIKNSGQILGMEQMSIQSPASRNFLNEWAFHQNLIQEDVLTTRYHFINVLLNGKLLGIYAIEDHFTGELIESQGRRQGLIIRFNEELMWTNMSVFWADDLIQGSNLSVTNAWTASIDAFQDTKLAENPTLTAEAETAKNLLKSFQDGQLLASEVFDIELWGRFFALHDLWSAPHGTAWHNLRFYYNPITTLLEPVAFDAEPFFRRYTMSTISSNFIETKIFNDPLIRAAYAKELFRLTSPEYIAALIEDLTPEHNRLKDALNLEFPLNIPIPERSVVVDWDILRERAQSLHLELQPGEIVRGSYQVTNVLPGTTGEPNISLDLVNLMMIPVDLLRVKINNQNILADPHIAVLPPVIDPNEQGVETTHIVIPLTGEEEINWSDIPKVQAVFQINGLEKEYIVVLNGEKMPEGLQMGAIPRQPTLEQVLQKHSFLQSDPDGSNKIIVSPGIWDVEGDLIIPENMDLFLPAGTVLRFGEGNILFSTGGLNLFGTTDAPVILTAQGEKWGGIIVINSIQTSEWHYAVVEKTAGISREGWVLTGGITFFKSPIKLNNTLISNNETEDAINVIHSAFSFSNCEFENTFADAFDSDFSTGDITNCYFHDVGGDAVDFSGSTVIINDTHIDRIIDKGVSAGEKSDITINNMIMDTISIGVASKDLSRVFITNLQIRNARFAALAAYIKKPVFGPGLIDARLVTIVNTENEAIVQKGSTVLIDGKAMETIDLDVDKLYNEGVLGN